MFVERTNIIYYTTVNVNLIFFFNSSIFVIFDFCAWRWIKVKAGLMLTHTHRHTCIILKWFESSHVGQNVGWNQHPIFRFSISFLSYFLLYNFWWLFVGRNCISQYICWIDKLISVATYDKLCLFVSHIRCKCNAAYPHIILSSGLSIQTAARTLNSHYKCFALKYTFIHYTCNILHTVCYVLHVI